jgi:hypothetical protein
VAFVLLTSRQNSIDWNLNFTGEPILSQVAQTIIAQLGGHRFIAMTGAKLVRMEDGLMINLPPKMKTKDRINKVIIRLDVGKDVYTVTFGRFWKLDFNPIVELDRIEAEGLRDAFERHTGLRTSL